MVKIQTLLLESKNKLQNGLHEVSSGIPYRNIISLTYVVLHENSHLPFNLEIILSNLNQSRGVALI